MIIYGTAILAACHLLGVYIGDLLGSLIGVKANVGGVGLAMMLLIAARVWLQKWADYMDALKTRNIFPLSLARVA